MFFKGLRIFERGWISSSMSQCEPSYLSVIRLNAGTHGPGDKRNPAWFSIQNTHSQNMTTGHRNIRKIQGYFRWHCTVWHGDSHNWKLGNRKHARNSKCQSPERRGQKCCQDSQYGISAWQPYFCMATVFLHGNHIFAWQPYLLARWKKLAILYVKFSVNLFYLIYFLRNRIFCALLWWFAKFVHFVWKT